MCVCFKSKVANLLILIGVASAKYIQVSFKYGGTTPLLGRLTMPSYLRLAKARLGSITLYQFKLHTNYIIIHMYMNFQKVIP